MTSDFSFLDDLPKDPQPDVSKAEIAIAPTKSKQKFEVGDLAVLPAEEGGSMIVKESNFKPSTPTQASFDPRFAFEVALGMESPDKIYPRYDLTEEEWYAIAVSSVFKKTVAKYQEEILEGGLSFRLKAKVQAEAYLTDAHLIIKHPLTPPAVKADMIKWVTKVADLEPKSSKTDGAPTFNLQINL